MIDGAAGDQMDKEIEDARRDLSQLPPSRKRDEAFRLLNEIEKLEAENKGSLDALATRLAAQPPPASELMFWRWLPWVTTGLACYAAYTGISAVLTEEYCVSGRGGLIFCSHGRLAQFQGVTVMIIAAIIFLMPMPTSRWRTVALWILWISVLPSLFLGLLERYLFV